MTFRFPPTWGLIAEGQSLATTTSGGLGGRWVDYLMRHTGEPPVCIAEDGRSWTSLSGDLATRIRPFLNPSLDRLAVLMDGGQGDLVEGDTAATIYADAGSHADLIRSTVTAAVPGVDVRVWVFSIPPNGLSNPGTIRPAANALLLADAGGKFDGYVDTEADPLDDPLDPVYYQGDNLHRTTEAQAIVAERARLEVVGFLPELDV